MKLSLEDKHYQILMDILQKYPYHFYAFGSRVKGNARKLSDLDIAVDNEISINDLANLEEDFTESDIPFKVDIISLNEIPPSFYKIIEKDLVKIK
ncbi:MAG: nucleotidyltransferase domain-containing protein [Pseudomonadota bacterium]